MYYKTKTPLQIAMAFLFYNQTQDFVSLRVVMLLNVLLSADDV